jgi:hypothetical protein
MISPVFNGCCIGLKLLQGIARQNIFERFCRVEYSWIHGALTRRKLRSQEHFAMAAEQADELIRLAMIDSI